MLPDLAELLDAATPFALTLKRPFRGLTVREGVLISGPSGFGEFAPFDDYETPAAGRWLAAAVEAAYGTWPEPVRSRIPVNAILPSLPLDEVEAWTIHARDVLGVRTVKVKVAEDDRDVERLQAVRRAFPDGRIRIDVNARWTLRQAREMLPRLADAAGGIEYVEQPLPDLGELAELRSVIDVPIAVDEGVRQAADPIAIADRIRAAGDLVVLKAAPLGGVARSLQIADAIGLPVVVSGSLDSSVGLAAGIALAAAVPELDYDCGFGTGALFAADLATPAILPQHGHVTVGRVDPDPELLAAVRLSGPAADRWHARLVEAYGTLVQ